MEMGITPEELRILMTARDEAAAKIAGVLALPDLDAEATITVQDVLRARREWLEVAPPRYRLLLDATPESPRSAS